MKWIALAIIIIIVSCGENNGRANAYIKYKKNGEFVSYQIKKTDLIYFFNEKRVLSVNQMIDGTLITVVSSDDNAYNRMKCPSTDPEIYGSNYSCKYYKY